MSLGILQRPEVTRDASYRPVSSASIIARVGRRMVGLRSVQEWSSRRIFARVQASFL